MTPNSATTFSIKVKPNYSDASEEMNDTWIQAPVSQQTYIAGNELIDGMYVQAKPAGVVFDEFNQLAQELAAWEQASDEALLDFESENY